MTRLHKMHFLACSLYVSSPVGKGETERKREFATVLFISSRLGQLIRPFSFFRPNISFDILCKQCRLVQTPQNAESEKGQQCIYAKCNKNEIIYQGPL